MNLVRQAQTLLTSLHYPCVIDGIWGPETRRQLGAFLYEHNLRDNEDPLPGGVLTSHLDALKKAPGWVRGIDVAKYQFDPDFTKVKKSGISFCFAKSSGSDGKSAFYRDGTFPANWIELREVGILRGAYHFHAWEDDPTEQADRFADRVGQLLPGDLPPVLDVENRTHPIRKDAALKHLHTCLEEIEKAFGIRPILYTSAGVLQAHGINTKDSGLEKYPLWVPRYETSIAMVEKSVPACYPGKRAWKFWQVGFDNDMFGIPTVDVDRNFFQGSLAELKAMCVPEAPKDTCDV